MSKRPALQDRVDAVERLTQVFRIERFVYLGVTLASFLLLVTVTVQIIWQGSWHIAELSLLFGSSGVITITGARILQMWNQALRYIASEPENGRSSGAKDNE